MIRPSNQRLVNLLAVAVVTSVAVAAGPITWRLVGLDDGRRTVAAVAPPPAAAPVDLAPLKRLAPFGTRVAVAAATGDPTAAGLQLRGVLLARPAARSIALISAAGGPAKGFAIGETLPGGAVLDTVEYDLAVVRVDGRLVTLSLPVRPGGMPSPSPVPAAAIPSLAAPAARAAAGPIEAYRERAQDPLSLLGSLGASAGPDGYRIGATPSDDLKRAGLQPGDIVEKVNGEPVGNPARDRALFDEAVVAGRMRVDIVRDGKHLALSFPLH